MSSNPKQLVVEEAGSRETHGKIVGTRDGLQLLAQDLAATLQKVPEGLKAEESLDLPGWQQHSVDARHDGFMFTVVPDVETYLKQRRATFANRKLPFLLMVLSVMAIVFLIIGFSTVVEWIVSRF